MQIQLISIRLERPFTDAEVERLSRRSGGSALHT